jgi:SNF family Na+-dependent transporter
MLSFLMKHTDVSERLALTSSTLVGAILYHLTLTAGIPPVGYLTFADKFMVGNYVITFTALAVTVMLMWYANHDMGAKAIKLHNRTRWTIPALWVILMVTITALEFLKG